MTDGAPGSWEYEVVITEADDQHEFDKFFAPGKHFKLTPKAIYKDELAPSGKPLCVLMVIRDIKHRWNYMEVMITRVVCFRSVWEFVHVYYTVGALTNSQHDKMSDVYQSRTSELLSALLCIQSRTDVPVFYDWLREKRKEVTEERNSRGETYEEFMAQFREFCNKVKAVHLHVDFEDANEVAAVEKFLASNPSIEDLPAYDEDYIEYLYRRQERYPEWREELADYRDIVAENTPEELDRLQAEARLKLPTTRDMASEKCSGGYPMYLVTQGRQVGIWKNWTMAKTMVDGYPESAYRGHHSVEGCIQEWQLHCALGVHPHPVDPGLSSPPAPVGTRTLACQRGRPVDPRLQAKLCSSVTAETWADVPAASRYLALWRGNIVYSDRQTAKAAFMLAEQRGGKPCILSTTDYEEAQAFSEGVYWVED
ncbi:hypothetical protein K438DRAFT_1944429 [Mycena galopus ATCC 62051]|nr:hypothetical protein K438DRAFT_1944429 [Mycena galopus ATCC 62051]